MKCIIAGGRDFNRISESVSICDIDRIFLVITDLGDENDTLPKMPKLKDYVTNCHDT